MNNIATPRMQVDTSAGTTYSGVSRQWFTRPHDQKYLNLYAMRDALQARKASSKSEVVDVRTLELTPNPDPQSRADLHDLWVEHDGQPLGMTHYSFGQLASLATVGQAAPTLRRLPAYMAADVVSYGLQHLRGNELVQMYSSHDGDAQLRAVTGPEYGRVYDADVVDAIIQVAGSGTGEMHWKIPGTFGWTDKIYDPEATVTLDTTTLYASDRDVFVFLVDDRRPIEIGKLPNGEPDHLFRGFIVENSEVGTRSLKVKAFYLRGVCQNRMLWGVEDFQELQIRHSKTAPDRFLMEATPALESFANGSSRTLLEGVQTAKAARVAQDDEGALEWVRRRGHSKAQAQKLLQRHLDEEQAPLRSVWDYANAVTAEARGIPNTDNRVQMEGLAEKALNAVT